MGPREIAAVEANFELLAPRGADLLDAFLDELPRSAERSNVVLLGAAVGARRMSVLRVLGVVVKHLRYPTTLRALLHTLGKQHDRMLVPPEHYPVIRDALLAAMGRVSGAGWSEALARDWMTAMDAVFEEMRAEIRPSPAAFVEARSASSPDPANLPA